LLDLLFTEFSYEVVYGEIVSQHSICLSPI
jgi:hypothetical protein